MIAEQMSELRALVDRHRVRCAVYPEWGPDAKWVQQKVGFRIELTGVHAEPMHTPEPGCDECVKVYEDLKKIALAILPTEHRPTTYEIEPFHPNLTYSHQRPRSQPEVTLTIVIYHRDHYRDPIDKCEESCLDEMRRNLGSIGVPQ